MELLTSYTLRNRAEAHFEAIQATPGIDAFCSSLDWIIPAYEAFIPDHPLYLCEGEHGFVTLARGFNPRIGRYFQPLEASWCLACPFVGSDPGALIKEFSAELASRHVDWDVLYLSGIPQTQNWMRPILRHFGGEHRIGLGHETKRYVASLEDGAEGFLGRRSSKFRANLRQALKKCGEESIEFERVFASKPDEVESVYDRIVAIEERSWKGQVGSGILDSGMNLFYRIMLPRLARRGALRVLFAKQGTRDLGFVFGGLLGTTYRGLQLSFDTDFQSVSLGNVLQYKIIEALAEEGVLSYDLGSELEYKARWAESRLSTFTLWIWR